MSLPTRPVAAGSDSSAVALPACPVGHRWKVKKDSSDGISIFTTYTGLTICLQRRILGLWWWSSYKWSVPAINGKSRAEAVSVRAQQLLKQYETDKAEQEEKESLYGVYQQDQNPAMP